MEVHEHHHHHHEQNDDELIKQIKAVPLSERPKVIALSHHMDRKKALDEELEDKISQLQKEYDLKALPFLEQMNQLITGSRAPSKEELEQVNQYFTAEEQAQKEEVLADSSPIPEYWHKVLKNC